MLIFLKMKYIYHEKEKPRFDIIQILRITQQILNQSY